MMTTVSRRRLFPLIILALCPLVTLSGCAQFVLLSYVLGGPPSIEPDFDAQTGLSLDGKEVTVAVLCYVPTELEFENPKVDVEVASALAFRLAEHRINVIGPDHVRAWIDEHPDWERPEEIGEALNASFVIDIELTDFSLYEENTHSLYRGRAEVYVKVIEILEDGTGEEVYSTELNSLFPHLIPRSTQESSLLEFKREYLSRLSEELGWLFYERYNGDKIPWAT